MKGSRTKNGRRRGQTIVFLLLALTILIFAFLWNVDLHRLVSGKISAQDAGDAAAIAAARWQGETLNLVGNLNLAHGLAVAAGDDAAIDAITQMQARICFTGPLAGLVVAQIAAKNNRVYQNEDFTDLLKEHADEVRRYDEGVGDGMIFPEPFEGAWDEYAAMLDAIAADGLAAAPDNAMFFGDATGGHILLEKGFYEAVAGRDWCWFYLNTATSLEPPRTLLDDFVSYETFGPLPAPSPPRYENSEIFGVGVHAVDFARGLPIGIGGGGSMASGAWYYYSSSMWGSPWPGMNQDEADPLPMAGQVKPEYDYAGADAVVRLYYRTYRMTSQGKEDDIVWTAAAKPFGYVESEDGARVPPHTPGVVLPAFRDVRLIPIDAATSGGDGSFDVEWRRHTDEHIPVYLSCGRLEDGCTYCSRIRRFEEDAFRNAGIAWLRQNHEQCTRPPPGGGGGRGGGSRRGH